MQIGVYGYTDKRPLVYALMKVLQSTGDVVLFSNNRHYKRLLDQGESQGHFANIMISVSDASPDEVFEEIGYSEDDFDHILFDLQEAIPEKLSLIFYVKSYPPNEDEQAFLDILDQYHTVKMTYDGRREKGAIHLAPFSNVWKAVEEIEAYRILKPIPSKAFNKGLASVLAPPLNITPKTAMTLLTRRWSR